MRMWAFASRNRRELLRDPLTLIFGIGFPIVLLLLMTLLRHSIPGIAEIYQMEQLAPAMAVFGLSFISLFSGMLLSNDRGSSFLLRVFASPLTPFDYIAGYALPLFVISILQSAVCFAAAVALGLSANANLLLALVVMIPDSCLFIGLGLLLGTLFNIKQVGGIASILINVAAWLSGTWFDLNAIGGAFKQISYALPFAHAVDAARAAVAGDYAAIGRPLCWVLGYSVVIFMAVIWAFRQRMKS